MAASWTGSKGRASASLPSNASKAHREGDRSAKTPRAYDRSATGTSTPPRTTSGSTMTGSRAVAVAGEFAKTETASPIVVPTPAASIKFKQA